MTFAFPFPKLACPTSLFHPSCYEIILHTGVDSVISLTFASLGPACLRMPSRPPRSTIPPFSSIHSSILHQPFSSVCFYLTINHPEKKREK